MNVRDITKKYKDYIIEKRRYFHMNPEPSFNEYDTSKVVQEELTKIGIPFEIFAKTGIIATIKGQNPGKTVLLRADMDALEVCEKNNVSYRSQKEGLMHACGHDGHIAMLLGAAHVLNENNEIIELNKEDMQFGYRYSILQDHPKWILIDALFTMTSKDPASIKAVLDKRKERRMATQPWNMPSAGSVFRNPEKKSAWQYIDEAGLRGYEIGGAQVSPKHSNFIVNNGYASGKDILELITHVESTVYNKSGIHLEKEVILVNWE